MNKSKHLDKHLEKLLEMRPLPFTAKNELIAPESAKLTALAAEIQACNQRSSFPRTTEQKMEFGRLQDEFMAQKAVCDELRRELQPALDKMAVARVRMNNSQLNRPEKTAKS